MNQSPERLYSIEQLKKFPGYSYDFLAHMLNIFVSHSGRTMDDFAEGLKTSDAELIKGAAHRIRPSVEFLQIEQVTGEIKRLEKWPDGFNTEMAALADHVSSVLTMVIEQVKADLESQHWN